MREPLPVVLIPGLNCSARLYGDQIPALWRFGPVQVADHTRDDRMSAIAARVLAAAPPRFALVGLSMGGYIVFEIMRQAPARIAKLALLDTGARADSPEQAELRIHRIELAKTGRFAEATDSMFPLLVHPAHRGDSRLLKIHRLMAEETGAEAFVRQQQAIMHRVDSRPGLAGIHVKTLVLVGDSDELTPPALGHEIAAGIPGARLVIVRDSGHLSTIEQPEAVAKALMDWMDE